MTSSPPTADASTDDGPGGESQREPRRLSYRLIWRWHFYAGLIVGPFLCFLSLTGALYLFKPQLEAWADRELTEVPVTGEPRPLSEQIAAARAAHPGQPLIALRPAVAPGSTTAVDFPGRHGGAGFDRDVLSVYVDPYTARVLGERDAHERFMYAVRKLHSSLYAGTAGNWLVEAVAGWALLLVASGIYLWWPRGRGSQPAQGARRNPRLRLRRLHTLIGLSGGALIVAFVATGLPWTEVWGGGLRRVQAWTGSQRPDPARFRAESSPPRTKELAPGPNAVPWAAEALPVPSSAPRGDEGGSHEGHAPAPVVDGLGWPFPGSISAEQALAVARAEGAVGPVALVLPSGATGVYTVTTIARADPAEERTLHIDQYSGAVLRSYGWAEYGALARGVSLGIALHEGRRFGPLNQALNLAAALALVALVLTGAAMWWRRRPRGSGALGAPRRLEGSQRRRGLLALLLVAGALLPLAGLSLLLVLCLDALLVRRIPALARYFGSD